MLSTPNMNLVVWDQESDDFDNAQLAADLIALDSHDHSSGKGTQVGTAGIATGAVATGQLANDAVTNPKVADNAIGTSNIQDNAVTGAKLAAGTVTGSDIAANTIGYNQLDANVMPLGSVVMWWRPAGSNALPGGNWEIMDGRQWSTISNNLGLNIGAIPDMRGAFGRGADVNGTAAPGIGVTSGANAVSLAHAHFVEPHAHPMATHSHPIVPDGDHYHTWVGGLDTWARANTFTQGITVADTGNVNRQNTFFTLYIKNILSSATYVGGNSPPSLASGPLADGPAHMDNTGTHSHSGFTGRNDPYSTNPASSTTDSQLGSTPIVPQSVGMLYIMRVR